MLKDRLKEKANAQPEMSCSGLRSAGTPWVCSGWGVLAQPAREGQCCQPWRQWAPSWPGRWWLPYSCPFVPQGRTPMTLSNALFCQKPSALLSPELLPPALPNPILSASPVQSRSPSHSPGHSLPQGLTCPRIFFHEDPSISGAAGVLLATLPLPPAMQEIGWDLHH